MEPTARSLQHGAWSLQHGDCSKELAPEMRLYEIPILGDSNYGGAGGMIQGFLVVVFGYNLDFPVAD